MEKDPDVRVDKLFVVGEVMPVEVSTLPFLCRRSVNAKAIVITICWLKPITLTTKNHN